MAFEDRSQAASDEALARRVQLGDRGALELLIGRYVRRVHAVAASYLRERADVEDAAQETFLRVIRGIAAYDPLRPFAPWLYQIARNVSRSQLLDAARRASDPLRESLSNVPAPDTVFEQAETRRLVDAAIKALPERRRTAFCLCDVEGYPADEVARLMGLSPGTVRSHVHHARAAIRRAVAETGKRLNERGGSSDERTI